MEISAWLRSLGPEQYEPAFRDNEIDADVLPELTEAHLERMGFRSASASSSSRAAKD